MTRTVRPAWLTDPTQRRTRPTPGRAYRGRSACQPPARAVGPGSAGPASLPALLARDVVDQDVLPQALGGDEERAPPVDPGHLVHELREVGPALQHERVDHDPVAGAAPDLSQRLLDGLERRRVGEVRPAVFVQVGR